MRRMMSSFRPLGAMSCSMSVTNPYLYSVFASCSMTSVDVDMCGPEVLGLGSWVLSGERLAASARALRVRVSQREVRGHQVVLVEVEHRAVQQLQAARV